MSNAKATNKRKGGKNLKRTRKRDRGFSEILKEQEKETADFLRRMEVSAGQTQPSRFNF